MPLRTKPTGLFAGLFIALAQTVSATTYFQRSSELPLDEIYDFIVIGSGAGGGTVAMRLAENETYKVLLIEAGRSNKEIFETQVPGFIPYLAQTNMDWNFVTVPQVHANNREIFYSRAKVLGGCTSHNGMIYTRGSKDDYDRWASVIGDQSYSWDNMFPYILKSETYMEDVEHQNEDGHLDPSIHGQHGPLAVTAAYTDYPLNRFMMQTTEDLPDDFPFKLDMNDGRPIGIGYTQTTINQGVRSSAATAFIANAGDNLHVLLNTYVTRVLPSCAESDDKTFTIVEFEADPQSLQTMEARREVIISGGNINTPMILLNSGIGDSTSLQSLGIPPLVHNPSVGKNLSDQIAVPLIYSTSLPQTNFSISDPVIVEALAEWNKTHSGLLSSNSIFSQIGWVRLPGTSPALQGQTDPTAGENSPHIEFYPYAIDPPAPDSPSPSPFNNSLYFLAYNLHPVSRGSLTLRTSNPFDYPAIDFNLLASDLDVSIVREGVRITQKFFSAPAWENSVSGIATPTADVASSDELLNEFIRANAQPMLHAVGSASMSPKGASWGVVDPEFRVKGANGLRVVDGSVLSFVPSGHTQAPIYAFAEKAADLIRRSWE